MGAKFARAEVSCTYAAASRIAIKFVKSLITIMNAFKFDYITHKDKFSAPRRISG